MLSPLINYYDADMSEDDTPRATHCSDQEYAPEINDSTDEETDPYVKNKADKRQREKTVKFSYKQHTNLYYKPEWTIAPGYSYPGPTSITHKLITAAPAPKVVKPARGDIAARIARSKAVLNRPDKTAFGPEEELNFKQTYPRRQRTTWGNLGLIPPGNYYPTGRIDFWRRGEPSKPFRMSYIDAVNTW